MNGAKWSSIARRSAANSLPHFQFCGLEIVSAEGEDDDVRREGGQLFKLRQVPVANQSFKHPGLIQESVGADVRRLCFIGILKLSLLTSAPTLRLYLGPALSKHQRSSKSQAPRQGARFWNLKAFQATSGLKRRKRCAPSPTTSGDTACPCARRQFSIEDAIQTSKLGVNVKASQLIFGTDVSSSTASHDHSAIIVSLLLLLG